MKLGRGGCAEAGGPDLPVIDTPALHRGTTQDSRGAPAGRVAVLPHDSQGKSGVFAPTDAARYTAPRAAFTVLSGSG
jgi:hypothetical protein